jgi:hypothetical protein
MPGPSEAQRPFTLLVLTRIPSPPATSNGTNTRAVKYTPCQSMAKVRSHSARSPSTKLLPPPTPALAKTRLT